MAYRTFLIGRDANCDLTISDATVSRRHAELVVAANGTALLSDRRSSHGTHVGEKSGWRSVNHLLIERGMRLRFGKGFEIDAARLIALALEEPDATLRETSVPSGLVRRNPEDGSILPG